MRYLCFHAFGNNSSERNGIDFDFLGIAAAGKNDRSLCAGEAVLCKLAEKYFRNELAAGTPFTFDGAKELMLLGICTICIPIGTAVISGIVYGIMSSIFSGVADYSFSNATSVGLGVMFIVMSLLCRYGAEITQNEGVSQQ